MEETTKKLTVQQLVGNIEKCGQLRGIIKSTPALTKNEKIYQEGLGYMIDAYEKLANSYINHIS